MQKARQYKMFNLLTIKQQNKHETPLFSLTKLAIIF